MSRRSSQRSGAQRDYPRTARLNELFREIVAEALGEIEDDRLDQVTVTTVKVEPDLRHAIVYFDSLFGEDVDSEVLDAFAEHRWRLQGSIGRQARTKRVPELSFMPDPAVRAGERIDNLLRASDVTPEPLDDDAPVNGDAPVIGDSPVIGDADGWTDSAEG